MDRKVHKQAFFLPLIYLGIIVMLIFLQFSGRTTFAQNFGQLTVSGTRDINQDSELPQINSLMLTFNGLQFTFNANKSVRIHLPDNSLRELFPKGYRTETNTIMVDFDQGLEFTFFYSSNQLTIIHNISDLYPNSLSIDIPINLTNRSSYEKIENSSDILITNRRNQFTLTIPEEASANFEAEVLSITRENFSETIRYARRFLRTRSESALLSAQFEAISAEEYETTVNQYIDKAYGAWRSTRFNSSTGTWIIEEGEDRFSEEVLVSLLAEALQRGEFASVYNDIQTVLNLHTSDLTYRSATFLGDLRRIINELDNYEEQLHDSVNRAIDQKNISAVLREDLPYYILSSKEYTQLFGLFEELNTETLTLEEAFTIILYYYIHPILKGRQVLRSSALEILYNAIIPAILRVDKGFFFQSDSGIANSYFNLLAGLALISAGEEDQNISYVAVGRNIIASILALSDQFGFIPAELRINSNEILEGRGQLAPETIYHHLSKNPYYPQYIDLSEFFSNGAWAYASIAEVELSQTSNVFTLSFLNNPNRTHYLFFRGLPNIDPSTGLQLYGIVWQYAPDFEIYPRGQYYNPENHTIMIKFSDEAENQDIRIFY